MLEDTVLAAVREAIAKAEELYKTKWAPSRAAWEACSEYGRIYRASCAGGKRTEQASGVGGKSALRLAYHIIDMDPAQVRELCEAITAAKRRRYTTAAYAEFLSGQGCARCAPIRRDRSVICVVRDPRDVMSMERMHDFSGVYHVLHGTISP